MILKFKQIIIAIGWILISLSASVEDIDYQKCNMKKQKYMSSIFGLLNCLYNIKMFLKFLLIYALIILSHELCRQGYIYNLILL